MLETITNDTTTYGWQAQLSAQLTAPAGPAIDASEVSRRFGTHVALDRVSFGVNRGEVHALLGPNGAGKTTLLRILSGLISPTEGSVSILGRDAVRGSRELRQLVGLVPSGDRTFYLRISGFENLVFFGRLYGLRRREARARARELLEAVGLGEAGNARVGNYSHGMQKRLSVARALVPRPAVLLVDEATHDLDPAGAESVRALVRSLAVDGAAVVWTTQRVEEVRPLANRVTLLQKGQVCFAGSVPELMAQTLPRRFFVEVRNGSDRPPSAEALGRVLGGLGTISGPVAESGGGHYLLGLSEGAMLGEAVSRLVEANYDVLSCRHERPEIEDAFLHLTGERG